MGIPGGSVVNHVPEMQEMQQELHVRSLSQGRSPGEGNGNPHQYSCLENSSDRGAWQAIVNGVEKSQILLGKQTNKQTKNSAGRGREDKLAFATSEAKFTITNPNILNNSKQEVCGMTLISLHYKHSHSE